MKNKEPCLQHVCRKVKETRLYPVFLVLVEKLICQRCGSTREAVYKLINRDNIIDMKKRKDSGRLNTEL